MNINEVKSIIVEERDMYISEDFRFAKANHKKRYLIWKSLAAFRMAQYWKDVLGDQTTGVVRKLCAQIAYRYYLHCRNIYGEKAGMEIVSYCRIGC